MNDELNLTVAVPADELAYMHRRLTYLETLLIRVVRDEADMREWYSAAELAALRLSGLPGTRNGITHKATREGWERRNAKGPNGGWCYVYHVSAFPARTFDALLSRILALPPVDAETLFDLPPQPEPPDPLPENAAPQWVLPLMRIMRYETNGDLGRAWAPCRSVCQRARCCLTNAKRPRCC